VRAAARLGCFASTLLAVTAFSVGGVGVSASGAATTGPDALIDNVPAAQSVYGLHDSAGHTMDTLKVVTDPTAKRYLGVYHWATSSGFSVGVATSTDLLHWTYVRTLDTNGSQPYLAFSPPPKNGPILAVETATDNHLRFAYWTSVSGMLGTAAPYKTFDAARTLSTCAEGTPDIRSVTYASSSSTITNGSTIVVGHHYYAGCKTDREALGTLVNFSKWSTTAQTAVDTALTNAGAAGKHGDRDTFTYGSTRYTLYEGSVSGTSFSEADWRNYLYDGHTAHQLTIHTAGGSTAFANPTATVITDPAGARALLVTQFIPSSGAAAHESGELLYWQAF
jgi:hypothetical protein